MKPPRQVRDELSELLGLLRTHERLITNDIGPLAVSVVIASVRSLRDAIPLDDDATKPFVNGRST